MISARETTDLARFQAALLDALSADADPRAVRQALLERADLAAFHSYVREWEDRMIEVASGLVKKWGRRAEPESQEN